MTGPTPISKPHHLFGKDAVETVKQLDETLVLIADALRRGQPCYTGKLGLKWAYDGGRFKTPYVVAFTYNRAGLPRSRKVKSTYLAQKAKNRSSFQINYYEVRKLLQLMQELLRVRNEITVRMGQFERWECSLAATRTKIRGIQESVNTVRADIEYNLYNRMTKAQREAARFEDIPEGVIPVAQSTEPAPLAIDEQGGPAEVTPVNEYLQTLIPAGAIPVERAVEASPESDEEN